MTPPPYNILNTTLENIILPAEVPVPSAKHLPSGRNLTMDPTENITQLKDLRRPKQGST